MGAVAVLLIAVVGPAVGLGLASGSWQIGFVVSAGVLAMVVGAWRASTYQYVPYLALLVSGLTMLAFGVWASEAAGGWIWSLVWLFVGFIQAGIAKSLWDLDRWVSVVASVTLVAALFLAVISPFWLAGWLEGIPVGSAPATASSEPAETTSVESEPIGAESAEPATAQSDAEAEVGGGIAEWFAGRATAFGALMTDAATSVWAWVYLALMVASFWALTNSAARVGVVTLGFAAGLFLVGPDFRPMYGTGVELSIGAFLTSTPTEMAHRFLSAFGEQYEYLGFACLMLAAPIVALSAPAFFAAMRGAIASMKAQQATGTPGRTTVMTAGRGVFGYLIMAITGLISVIAVWQALGRGGFRGIGLGWPIVGLKDVTEAALLGGWSPQALLAAGPFATAFAVWFFMSSRFIMEDKSTGLGEFLAYTFLGGIVGLALSLFAPAGAVLFVAGLFWVSSPFVPLIAFQYSLIMQMKVGQAPKPQVPFPHPAPAPPTPDPFRPRPPSPAPPPVPVSPKSREPVPGPGRPVLEGVTLVAHPVGLAKGCIVAPGVFCLLDTNGQVCLYRGGELAAQLRAPAGLVHGLVASAEKDDTFFVSNGGVEIIESATGASCHVSVDIGSSVDACAVNGFGTLIALARPGADAGAGSSLSALFLSTGEMQELGVVEERVQALACSTDNRWICAIGGEGTAFLLDLATRDIRRISLDGVSDVAAVSAMASDRWAVAAGKRIILFDAAQATTVAAHSTPRKIVSFATAADGSTVAAGSARGMVHVRSGELSSQRFEGAVHEGRVLALGFGPDGSLVSIGADGTVRKIGL